MDVFFSDFDSYSESSSSSEDHEDDELMYGGHASCILSNLEDTIGKIDDFFSFEREYVHGDIVCSIDDPSRQMGKVINLKNFVDLENLDGNKLEDIDSKKLQRICSISNGDYVVAGPWVGKADKIVDRVTVLFDDGAKCEFTTFSDEKLIPLSPDLVDDSQYPYYPGQQVKVKCSSSIFNSSRWFCGTHQEKQDKGTICEVDTGFVYVNWLARVPFGLETTPKPPCLQSSEDLTSLSDFPHWQLGDWCVLANSNHTGRFSENPHPKFQEIFVISKTKTKVDVLWQDGTKSWGLDSGSLGPVNILDAHDFWPHQFVLEKGTSEDQQFKKWGFVKSVDGNEKTVKVKWEEKGVEETVSAYELSEHPDFSYCWGDVVFLLEKGKNVKNNDKCLLSRIGIVIGFKDGNVEVKWAAGFSSEVAPHEIFRMDKSEGISATPLLHDDNIEPNQEKSDHDGHVLELKAKVKTNISEVAVGFLSDVAARLFGPSLLSTSNYISEERKPMFDSEKKSRASVETCTEANIKEKKSKDVFFASNSKNLEEFGKFEMVNDCSNHHFIDHAEGLISKQVKRCWLKKVQQEWNILMKDLPETIYVRVFEERMDLLHAAIVGAPGTPYHDGLFFFDIFLPPEYPYEPPMVHYSSGGLRINPNLYESGKVCLSLLDTWTGTGSETWNPEESTMLQVLLSLQALVLNENPYFNEAGYDQQVGSVEGEKNSCSYNENVFLVSCKSMLYTLRNPPKHFEALVEEHFKKRCKCILMACKAYMDGIPVCYALEGQTTGSTGFKIALSKLFPKLVEAFIEKGIDCGEYAEMGKMIPPRNG